LLLPGRLKRRPWEHRHSWPTVDQIAGVARNTKLPILFQTIEPETKPFYTAVSGAGKKLPLEVYQQFSTGKNATPEAVKGLVKECNPSGERAIDIAGLTVGLLICGENNVLTNKRSDHNRGVRVRHSRARDLFRGVRLIFNGAHTKMGNWGKLEWRFRFLSKHKRWFFYATNNNDKREKWGKSTLCVYYNRRRIATSAGLEQRGTAKQEVNGKIKWEDVHLRGQKDPISFALVTSKHDRCIILTVDIPGKLLQ
jgi:hypothetical protein